MAKAAQQHRSSKRPNKAGKTPREVFLAELRKIPVVSYAARQSGLGRTTVYDLRANDESFAKEWDDALDEGIEHAEQIAWSRGTKAKGASDTLLIFMLKAHKPEKYRERVDINQRDLTLEQMIKDAAGTPGTPSDPTPPGSTAL